MITMAIYNKKRDFKKLSVCIQEFLSKLPCDEGTGFLRDTLYLSLLELHKYYLKVKERLNLSLPPPPSRNSALILTAVAHYGCEKYDERWHGYQLTSSQTNSQGFLAAREGNIRNLKDIVHSDDVDELGQTCLMYAVYGKSEHQVECIEYLLSLKFDIDRQANDGRTALHLACQYAQKTMVVTLLKNKASTRIQDNKGRAALHWAAISPSSDIVKLLLQHGADINVKDCDSMMPAMWACHFNKLENLHVLKNALERIDPRPEAIFDGRDKNGETVLHWAVPSKEKDSEALQCLKDLLVCDVSWVRNDQGRTVLHTAVTKGCVPACELVLSICGKDILNIKDKQNQTAIHLATLCGHGETVDYLLQNGANTSDENSSGRTALEEAEFGHFHYCLLVYAAFEHMKSESEKNKPLIKTPIEDERNDEKSKKYESWVIPTGFLHDSQDIPEADISHDPERQLVDVTELKGFEVNGELETPRMATENIPISKINENASASKAKQSIPLQRSIRVEDEAKDDEPLIPEDIQQEEVEVVNGKTQFNALLQSVNEQLEEEELLEYSSQYLQQHGSVLSNHSSDDENYSVSENMEISSLGEETDEETKSEHAYSEKQKKNKEAEKKTDSKKSEEAEVENGPSTEMESNGLNSQDIMKGHRGNLAPIKPSSQPSFSILGKLDPIPLSLTTRKTLPSQNGQALQPRGIVAPLQPPASSGHQKERPVLLRDKRSYSDNNNTPSYGSRGPDHGPLAQTHGKALLSDVFQDVSKRTSDGNSPETQRRAANNKAGKLPHPPAH